MLKIYHHPRCSKSRQCLELLLEAGYQPELIEYLKKPPSVLEMKGLLKLLHLNAEDLVRKKEAIFLELNLKNKKLSENEWIELMLKHPVLIERPIVVSNDQAVIARPAEKVWEILKKEK